MDTKVLENKLRSKEAVVCVVGLGYVGLPLAIEFDRSGLKVIGFDVKEEKIKDLKNGIDEMNEVDEDELKKSPIEFTSNPNDIKKADFIVVAVPTPITKSKMPDLKYVIAASETVGENMKRGVIVSYESTVYPGVTEEVCEPILEEKSGLKCGVDFKLGYSPERVNPGDKEHTIDKIVKVVGGMDPETTDLLAELYDHVTKAGTFKARDIKTAEAAKVIENVQRDLNIALMNELAIIFEQMGLSIWDVLDAAYTKWNFGRYRPGLVGGHCIPVDPYYLTYKAEELGYHPQIILAGRRVNDGMPKHVAELTVKALNEVGKVPKDSRVLLMGLAFKENVKDCRTSPSKGIIQELKSYGVEVIGYDPLLDQEEIKDEFGIDSIDSLDVRDIDAVVLATAHDIFREIRLDNLKACMNTNPLIVDARGFFDQRGVEEEGFSYRTL